MQLDPLNPPTKLIQTLNENLPVLCERVESIFTTRQMTKADLLWLKDTMLVCQCAINGLLENTPHSKSYETTPTAS